MAGGSDNKANGGRPRMREPAAPDLPASLAAATLPDHAISDSGIHLMLAFDALDLSDSEAAGFEVDSCRYRSVNLSRIRLRRAMIRDASFDHCDLANLRARDSGLSRATVSASRMTGVSWLSGSLRDVMFEDCRMDLASFAATKFKDVVFTRCRLEQADFTDSDLSGARFEQCDLKRAQFAGARMAGTRISGCDLDGIGGVTSLRGAIITSRDALAIAFTLASALGITIEDD